MQTRYNHGNLVPARQTSATATRAYIGCDAAVNLAVREARMSGLTNLGDRLAVIGQNWHSPWDILEIVQWEKALQDALASDLPPQHKAPLHDVLDRVAQHITRFAEEEERTAREEATERDPAREWSW